MSALRDNLTADGGDHAPPSSLLANGCDGELAVPIWVGSRPWGAIWLAACDASEQRQNAAARLRRFADMASAAIVSADARAHLAALANEDPLTGLANHRVFHEQLQAEISRARRHGRDLSLVIFDIDHFAEINDAHGHQAGDEALREVAAQLRTGARAGELVARIGGEQFAWIVPETEALNAYQAADRARHRICAATFSGGLRLTVSAGVCDLTHARSAPELVRLTDGALFWAKTHGRNIVFRYSPEVVTELSAGEQAEQLRRTRTILGIQALARAVDVKDASPHATPSASRKSAPPSLTLLAGAKKSSCAARSRPRARRGQDRRARRHPAQARAADPRRV